MDTSLSADRTSYGPGGVVQRNLHVAGLVAAGALTLDIILMAAFAQFVGTGYALGSMLAIGLGWAGIVAGSGVAVIEIAK